ncbi:hypothetical protein CDL12_09767 [Handroanthus impetiginosus]|uniref:Uncharacterized protein n=1 Tax=Handroanthus impetiginosus TaxID=429701 RepID=A0A2G9HJ75_9LAMI|nr:hypothetical protein CDL12_09767 [Handroanthus impetiginosus]
MNFLHSYEAASGQLINQTKSTFATRTRCPNHIIRQLKRITGFIHQSLPVTYLGAPLYVGNRKALLYTELLDKVRTKLRGWTKSTLSHGGRLLLIKKGGFGVRKLLDVVNAFSCKLWWLFRLQNSLWAKFTKAKYAPDGISVNYKIPASASPIWRRIFRWKEAVDTHIFWKIGSGALHFWTDHWCGDAAFNHGIDAISNTADPVANFWTTTGEWDVAKLNNVLPSELVDIVLDVPIYKDEKDHPIWKLSHNGNFTTKSVWELLRAKGDCNNLLEHLWITSVPPTISIFIWRLLHDTIPVDTRLQHKGIALASKCHCCKQVETLQHLFTTSDVAVEVWSFFCHIFHVHMPTPNSIVSMLAMWRNSTPFVIIGHIRIVTPLLVFWHIWGARNDAKHRNKPFRARRIIQKVLQQLYHIYMANKFKFRHWRGDPTHGQWKMNTDGAAKAGTGVAGAGGILLDHTGTALFAFTYFIGSGSSLEAELTAIFRGLHLAIARGHTNLWLETDSQVALHLIHGTQQVSWKLLYLIEGIRQLMQHFQINASHIYREGNRPADNLANMACNTRQSLVLQSEEFSRELRSLIMFDKWNLPSFRFN